MDVIWQFFVNTPWWVYVLLIYLLYIGVKASKTHRVKLPVMFIIPLVFVAMSLHTLWASFCVGITAVCIWSSATAFGAMLGWRQVFRYALKIDKKHKLIQVPGSWSTLVMVLMMFSAKYYFSYELLTHAPLVKKQGFENSALIIFGVGTGFFIGKLLCYLYRFKTLKHSQLVH